MKTTAIIYWSGTGNTEIMAEAIAEGAKSVSQNAALFTVTEISADAAAGYDVLILGCPAMGAEVLEEDEFEPFFSNLCFGTVSANFPAKKLSSLALTAGVTASGCGIGRNAPEMPAQRSPARV